MEKKYKILGEFIKDISAETKDIESYIYTKENKLKYNRNNEDLVHKRNLGKCCISYHYPWGIYAFATL